MVVFLCFSWLNTNHLPLLTCSLYLAPLSEPSFQKQNKGGESGKHTKHNFPLVNWGLLLVTLPARQTSFDIILINQWAMWKGIFHSDISCFGRAKENLWDFFFILGFPHSPFIHSLPSVTWPSSHLESGILNGRGWDKVQISGRRKPAFQCGGDRETRRWILPSACSASLFRISRLICTREDLWNM